MNSTPETWENRLADLWKLLDDHEGAKFVDAMRQLTAELPERHPVALFEMGAAYDSTGSPQRAVELYKQALAGGLSGLRRLGREREALAVSLRALAAYLPRYNRSVARYAEALVPPAAPEQ